MPNSVRRVRIKQGTNKSLFLEAFTVRITVSVSAVTHWLTFMQHPMIDEALSHPVSYFILPTNSQVST